MDGSVKFILCRIQIVLIFSSFHQIYESILQCSYQNNNNKPIKILTHFYSARKKRKTGERRCLPHKLQGQNYIYLHSCVRASMEKSFPHPVDSPCVPVFVLGACPGEWGAKTSAQLPCPVWFFSAEFWPMSFNKCMTDDKPRGHQEFTEGMPIFFIIAEIHLKSLL